MSQVNYYSLLPNSQRRRIRHTQYITSMLATTEGKTYSNVDFIWPNGLHNGDGVSETFPNMGTGMTDISLRKRWKQARSLTTSTSVTDVNTSHPQANPKFFDTRTSGQDPSDSDVEHSTIDASDTTSNGQFSDGPYKMSSFFGFAHVEMGYEGGDYTVPTDPDTGFSTGMKMISNTDDGHPDLSTWFTSGKFPTGSGGQMLIYAGGEGTDYETVRDQFGGEGPYNGYNNNPSLNTVQLYLGYGRDSWYPAVGYIFDDEGVF